MTDDQITLQQSSKEFLKLLEAGKNIPDLLIKNWLTALILTHHSGHEFDSDTITLRDYLCSHYSCTQTHKEAFDLGVIYGLLLSVYYHRTVM